MDWILLIALGLAANVLCLRVFSSLSHREDGAGKRSGASRPVATSSVAFAAGISFSAYADRDIEYAIPLVVIPAVLAVMYRRRRSSAWLYQLHILSFWLAWAAGAAISWDTGYHFLLRGVVLLWGLSVPLDLLARLLPAAADNR